MKVLILALRVRIILYYSCSSTVALFKNQLKRQCSRSPDLESPTTSSKIQALSGPPGCVFVALLRPVPPITLAPSLRRSRSVPRSVVLDVQFSYSSPVAVDRAGDVPAFSRWVQTDQYCNPIPGLPLWVLALVTRSLLSCGRWFLTHWRYPQSALDRWCLWLLDRSVLVKPKLLDAGLSFASLKPWNLRRTNEDR